MRAICSAAALVLAAACSGASGDMAAEEAAAAPERDGNALRVATYNVSMYREEPGQLLADLRAEADPQIRAVTDVIAQVDPDVLVLNEFDYEDSAEALALFAERLGYPHFLALPSNTGIASGRDLDNDGRADHAPGSREYGGDAFGYGTHPGQYGIAVASRLPIDEDAVRTYRELLWSDMPGNLQPESWYDEGDRAVMRLSSKTHAVVPVETAAGPLNLVLAHPTPPGFDGAEDRNGLRNNDEVRLLLDIVDPSRGGYLRDDEGGTGGLAQNEMFVIAGDLNADAADGDVAEGAGEGAIAALLGSPLVTDPEPRSEGGPAAAQHQGEGNLRQVGDPALDTADFSDGEVGNLRVDYVLPSANLTVKDAGVFWPAEGQEGYALVGPGYPPVSSDHRMVWVDLELPEETGE
ncbi:endonuclease/exonuclease/phosphatase family protein [Parvularcula oceani]|uniref:endonuclease/exonuclease/phosphatase family protein n=1 Tax=Parvularcula oceani TaxID=1247963 RepID=UPI0004E18BB8|nr:endonuclease/exonuclease/phosphatase family protein [Parvularcula oceani]